MSRIYWITCAAALLAGCSTKRAQLQVQPAQQVSQPGLNASCAFITETPDGKPVISWVAAAAGSEEGTLCYAISGDGGRTFGNPVEVTPANNVLPHAENMPKLVFRPDGQIIAMYGVEQHDARNKYAGRVCYTYSNDKGQSWAPAQMLVKDTGSYDQRYFDLALLPDGKAAAIWLDNRKQTEAEGSTLYYAVNGGQGFEQERPLATTVCQCCRTDLYVDSRQAVHAVFRDIINDSIRDMVHMVSTNGGTVFSPPVRISADNWVVRGCPHTGPAIAENGGLLHFAWFTMGNGQGVFYCQSDDNGKTYTKKEAVSTIPMAKHPQIAPWGEKGAILVWDEPVKQGNTFNSRIGLQCRTAGGVLQQMYLTPDSSFASFPVIRKVAAGALVAFTRRDRVMAQLIGNE